MEIRELDGEMEYTTEERDLLSANGISVDELRTFLRASDAQNLDTAIGGILMEREQAAKELDGELKEQPEIVVSPEASKLPEDGALTS
jgi:hypothetical protein